MSNQEELEKMKDQIAADPANGVLYNNLGNLYFDQPDFEEAK
jgi:uncharacterized protein HemY